MTSNRALKRWYNKINSRFFYDELPRNVIVRWATPDDDEQDMASVDLAHDKRHKYEILINREKNPTLSVELNSLIHEMCHIATSLKDDHGAAFEKWRQTLGERGIFKKGALKRGLTIF